MTIHILAIAAAVSLGSSSGAKAPPPARNHAELKAVDDRFIDAFQKKDIEGLLSCYSDDAVLMDPGTMVARGKDEIRSCMTTTLSQFDDIRLELKDRVYEQAGDVGYSYSLFTFKARDKATGQPVEMQGRASAVMVKRGGKWVYRVDHASVPLPPPDAASSPKVTK
jgi:uncharacterized protein (TIGR02246 family)